jgi:hypothetical protein
MSKTQSIFYLPHGWMEGRMHDGREDEDGWMDGKDGQPRTTKPTIL